MSEESTLGIAAWLSEVSSDASPDSEFDAKVTPTRITQKRKRRLSDHLNSLRKHPRLYYPLTKTALAELSPNIMNPSTASPQKGDTKKTQAIMTPQTDTTKSSYKARSRPPTATPSSSSGAKQTANEDNVRAALAKQNMFFEDEGSFEKHTEFKDHIEKMVFGTRDSAMRAESIKIVKHWRAENATMDEKTFFAGAIPMILKDTRGVAPTNKRTFDGEIIHQATSFAEDGLDKREDCLFVKNIFPLRMQQAEAKLGLTNPKPDHVFGLKRPRHRDPDTPVLSDETEALIGVAPGLQHAFFAVENKGCQHSIEAAENQAMRTGATLVAARRALQRKAKGISAIGAATCSSAPIAPPITASAAINIVVPGPPVTNNDEEELGADTICFAFTCSWVPQMANLHVHWFERRSNGLGIYHMNLLGAYLMRKSADMTDFRRDLHNILDWGIGPERKESLRELEKDIARWERGEE